MSAYKKNSSALNGFLFVYQDRQNGLL